MSNSIKLNPRQWGGAGVRFLALLLLVGVFGWSGSVKLMDPEYFAISVYRYHLLPSFAVNIIALWISMLEVVCAVSLLFLPRLRVAVLWVIFGLLIVFSGGIAINLAKGNQISCGCFSSSPLAHSMGWFGIAKNVMLALPVCFLLWKLRASASIIGGDKDSDE